MLNKSFVLLLIVLVYSGVSVIFKYDSGIAFAETIHDPLTTPAEKTLIKTVLASTLFDVVNTGKRLVAVGERGHIVYSDDNQVTWIQADVPVSVTLTGVYFPTAREGWAVGHDGVVLQTSDGGSSWTRQLDGNQVNQLVLNRVKQLIEEKKTNGTGLEIEDLEYLLQDAETALEEGPARPFMDVWFKNEKQGFIIGAFGLILETRNGGKSWLPIFDRMENPDGFHYYGITRAGTSLYIAGESGMLFRSDNQGKSWIRLDAPYEGSFFGIVGDPEGEYVIAFGMGGKAYRSSDNGTTWEPIKIPTPASLSAGTALPDGPLLLSAGDGTILYSNDGGKLFTPLPVVSPGCTAIAGLDSGHIVLTGLRGMMQAATSK